MQNLVSESHYISVFVDFHVRAFGRDAVYRYKPLPYSILYLASGSDIHFA